MDAQDATAEQDACWICLEGSTDAVPLSRVCACPSRWCHRTCLSRWQLHSAGKQEESFCRFCRQQLPDWRPTMTPKEARVVVPFMRVSFGGRTFKVQVKPGPDGAKEFEDEIRKLLNLPEDQEFDVIFHCKAPGTGDRLQLQGLNAFDAAVHCASLSTNKSTAKQADAQAKQSPGILNKVAGLFRMGSNRPDQILPEGEGQQEQQSQPQQQQQPLTRAASAPTA